MIGWLKKLFQRDYPQPTDGTLVMTAGADCPKCGCGGVFNIDHETGDDKGYHRCEGCLTYWDQKGEEVPENEVPCVF